MRLQCRPTHLLDQKTIGKNLHRLGAALVCLCLLLTLLPVSVWAADPYRVDFVNYDLSQIEGTGPYDGVPEGARLCTADELRDVAGFTPTPGATWYLYLAGGGDTPSYSPQPIPDPPAREGYTFRDWAAQGAAGDDIYTVTGATTFVARYLSHSQYIINLYYQFDNENNTAAAETTTVPFGLRETFSIALPTLDSLKGLNPSIKGSAELNQMISGGTFSGTVDEDFLTACRNAGFVAWDEDAQDYAKDESGNVQINIPVTYSVTGNIEFRVEYWQQNPDNDDYTQVSADAYTGSVTGTTLVSLNNLGLTKAYEGFTLTAASAEDADSYNINADGSSIIRLYYDRDVYYLYYKMNGGNAREPLQLRCGQAIPAAVTDTPTRSGYTFHSWSWLDGDGDALNTPPTVMPNHDLTLEANWNGADTKVTLIYWLENANDDDYTVAGQLEIPVTSGQTVGYQDSRYPQASAVDVAINPFLDVDAMRDAGIPDGAYFTFASADSSTQFPTGTEGGPKVAEGDGSTVINIGYTRNEYTLVFHLGWQATWSYRVVSGGASSGQTADDWKSGYDSSFLPLGGSPEMSIGGRTYTITDDPSGWYQFSAKYGAYISDQWPVRELISPGGWTGWRPFYGWGTHNLSQYAQKHADTNGVINGVYSTMSADLIIDPESPETAHHLVAYFDWSTSGKVWTYHYLFEAVSGTGENGEAFAGSNYETYSSVKNVTADGFETIQGLRFYPFGSSMTILSLEQIDAQNAPVFSNVTYQYGCYSGNDVYFFYTYDDYTLTYNENNANLSNGTEAKTRTENFHYIEGRPVAEQIQDANYTPDPFVSSYGNEYTFLGWYTSNLTADATDNERFRVDWDTFSPSSNVNIYAAWEAPKFTLTLIVPGGTLYDDTLTQFEDKGYTVTSSTDGQGVTTYVVSGIPGGTKASEIVANRRGAQSSHGLAFDYWGYEVNGMEQRYLFDESQLVTGDLTLTARWKTEYTGQYTVRWLTTTGPGTSSGSLVIDGTTYYLLADPQTVRNVVVGSSVTVNARAFSGYLSRQGSITQVVEAPETQDGDSKTCYNFIYDPITTETRYTVHYVRDMGVDYGRTPPPAGIVELAPSKTVIVPQASLMESTSVTEAAAVVGGYTPRDGWNTSFTLSANQDQNHLYLYYVSNTYEVDFTVVYHFMDDAGGYPTDGTHTFTLAGRDALGKVLSVSDLVGHYDAYLADPADIVRLDGLMEGHALDTELTGAMYLLLTQAGTGAEGNTLHIYLRNGGFTLTYDLNDGGDAQFPAAWNDAPGFLTYVGSTYVQEVTYPAPADVPPTAPTRLSYTFAGWNTQPDGSGTLYTMEQLATAPWYQMGGLSQDTTLYAQWEPQLTVTYYLREGSWTDSSNAFHQGISSTWFAYIDAGQTAPVPTDPTYELDDGTAYSFIGWTDIHPDDWSFTTQEKRIDLEAFEACRYDFRQPVTQSMRLYAVWDPDVTTFSLSKTDTGGSPLSGAAFTLERLRATVTGNPDGGYTYTPENDDTGQHIPDTSFVVRTMVSDADGTLDFSNLPAGYYRLTETAAPDGYTGLGGPVILYAPYGGQAELYSNPYPSHVSAVSQGGDLILTVQNISQYSVTITAPDALTLTYTPPDYVWNPETLAYEPVGGTSGQWSVAAPEGQDARITVANNSQGGNAVEVSVAVDYDTGYEFLLPLSTLSAAGGGFPPGAAETALTGTLAANQEAAFTLTMEGTVPIDAALPPTETAVGRISVLVSKPSG